MCNNVSFLINFQRFFYEYATFIDFFYIIEKLNEYKMNNFSFYEQNPLKYPFFCHFH